MKAEAAKAVSGRKVEGRRSSALAAADLRPATFDFRLPLRPALVCAWCPVLKRHVLEYWAALRGRPVTHGICRPCAVKLVRGAVDLRLSDLRPGASRALRARNYAKQLGRFLRGFPGGFLALVSLIFFVLWATLALGWLLLSDR